MASTSSQAISDRGKNQPPPQDPKGFWERVKIWWSEFSLQTKLLAIATLAVSILMTGITFFVLNGIQRDAGINDTRYARDLGLLLSGNVSELISKGKERELGNVAEKFWRSSKSLRYIFFADKEGLIYLGIPVSGTPINGYSELQLTRRLTLPENFKKRSQNPLIRQHLTPQGQVTDVFVPLTWEGKFLGTLALGVNPNEKALANAALTREVTVAVFISIWVLVILGAVINTLTITRPVKELLRGVREIAAGKFDARISMPISGELGDLLNSFNAMALQLEAYDEANIEELTSAQVKQQSLIATMADGALLLDEEGKIVLANPTAKRLFRWEGRNLEGQELLNELPEILSNELHDSLTSILNRSSESNDIRCSLDEPNRTLRIVLQSVKDPNKETLKGIAVTVQDLTREVELNAAQSRFISNVSHELRTPLFNIKSYIETLHDLGDKLSEAEKIEFLGVANSEADRLTRLVNDVLDLSKLESGRSVQFESIDLQPALEQTLRNYKLNADEKKVLLKLDLNEDIPKVLGNWDLLLQVLDNLVGNALKFNKAGGLLILRSYTWPDTCTAEPPINKDSAPFCELISPLPRLRVEISDTGSGISKEAQESIFDRFYRVENSVHTETGTGLGLSIAQGIIQKHGGKIGIASEPGTGTTFWFDLPLEQADADEVYLQAERSNQLAI